MHAKWIFPAFLAVILILGEDVSRAAPGVTELVSRNSVGAQGNDAGFSPSLSAEGRYVAFASFATNLVPNDTNTCFGFPAPGQCQDIFVRDRLTRVTTRVSIHSDGRQSNGTSEYPVISDDGRYVAFTSGASNLIADDTNTSPDVFVHDRLTSSTVRVSVASDGTEGNEGSADPAVNADGRYVAFASLSSTLVPGDTNFTRDIFVHDRDADDDGIFDEADARTTTRVSVDSQGSQSNGFSIFPALSADGRYVVFQSDASNLVPGDTQTCRFGEDCRDMFVHDRMTGETVLVSVNSQGIQGDNYNLGPPDISADGRYVVFRSSASNLVPEPDLNGSDYDVFVHDRDADEDRIFDERTEPGAIATTRVNESSDGRQGNSFTFFSKISADGRLVSFWSRATNLVRGDTNSLGDIFVHDRETATTVRVSVASDGTQGNDETFDSNDISADGRHVAFDSNASNLVDGDTNGTTDVFLHNLSLPSACHGRPPSPAPRGRTSSGAHQGPTSSFRWPAMTIFLASGAATLSAQDPATIT